MPHPMKKILFLFVGWLTWGPLFAQSPQLDPLQDPEVMAVGTDETRYPLLPYNNMELALKGDIASSTYLQWLNGTLEGQTVPDADPNRHHPDSDRCRPERLGNNSGPHTPQ